MILLCIKNFSGFSVWTPSYSLETSQPLWRFAWRSWRSWVLPSDFWSWPPATKHFGHLGRVTMVLGSMANTCPKDYYAPGLIKLVRKLIELVIKYCMIFCSNNPMLNATDCPPHHGNLCEITGEIHHGLGVSPRPSTWEIT